MTDVVVVAVGARRLAVPAMHVRELRTTGFVTPVPLAPPPLAGVIALRGQVIPVLDLMTPPRALPQDTAILVLELGPTRAALVIDRLLPTDEEAEYLDVPALFAAVHRP